MKRREFIAGLGGAAAWPVMAGAQQAQQMRRIGVLMNGAETDSEMVERLGMLRKALQDLRWTAGANLRIDVRWGIDEDDVRKKAKELVELAPDVILANAPPSAMALLKATSTIPIVFAAVTDPVGLGIVQSLARPGGNATGFLTAEFGFGAKLLEILKEIAPGVRRVAVLREANNPSAL